MRIRIKPGLRRVWREAGTLQIGVTSRRGTVLHGLTADDVPLLEQLKDGVDGDTVRAPAGSGAGRRRELVALLEEAGVLVGTGSGPAVQEQFGGSAGRLAPDADVWSLVHDEAGDGWALLAGRAARQVVVMGAGRLGSTLAATLAAAGVGELVVGDRLRVTAADLAPGGAGTEDLGRPREDAALDAVRRFGSRAERADPVSFSPPARPGREKPDLVVLIEYGAADAAAASRLVSSDVPHLSVVVREDDVVVGPLVRPGRGPCLRCLDLHRGDRDPAWPSVLAQLLGPAAGTSRAGGPRPEETATAVLAAGLATLQVLAHLDGVTTPASAGATLEIELPDGLIARRDWPPHPACGCLRLPDTDPTADPPGDRGPADARFRPGTETMGS